MNIDALNRNYSPIGSGLIEKMYSDDYLSLGGRASTDIFIKEAAITKAASVLDVGSGLGGACLHLGKTIGCTVTGLDIVQSNVDEATARAKARSLDHLVKFHQGDAMAMPFDDGSFDVIISQDAWCHVPDKDRLLSECARVLAPGGTVAFTDWLQIDEMSVAQNEAIQGALVAANMATLDSYQKMLQQNGFKILHQHDTSAECLEQYRAIMARLNGMKDEICSTYSVRVYGIVREANQTIRQAFEDGKLGGGRIIAAKTP
ncbi:MAG: methyltransferase domain-containing protein [Alphaproteobacteria bacterium]|nr:methyltransferase domain-containing protein [Alphaproteobacteria bacterium]